MAYLAVWSQAIETDWIAGIDLTASMSSSISMVGVDSGACIRALNAAHMKRGRFSPAESVDILPGDSRRTLNAARLTTTSAPIPAGALHLSSTKYNDVDINKLSLDRSAPGRTRELARRRLLRHAEPAERMMSSIRFHRIEFAPPSGYFATNPSVAVWQGRIYALLRCVDYRIGAHGFIPRGRAIHNRNFLVHLDADLRMLEAAEVQPPSDLPQPQFSQVRGFEDGRLFFWRNSLWCSSTICELTQEGWCEIALGRIEGGLTANYRMSDWRVLTPEGDRQHQKNWMPRVEGDILNFVYALDPTVIVDGDARTITSLTPSLALDHLRGGSQAVPFDGGWLVLTHETIASLQERSRARCYLHRFGWLDTEGALRLVSNAFYFLHLGTEFAVGLTWHPNGAQLVASFGVMDREAWCATIAPSEVKSLLTHVL
jgi:hypothetical protein